jgi:hypothetical protein
MFKEALFLIMQKIIKIFYQLINLVKLLKNLLIKKAVGIYNVSLGKKVYLNKLINWLNLFNKNKYKCIDIPKSYKTECFYLNNDKLMKKINIKNRLIDLEKDCKAISKFFFKKKNK